MQAPTHLIAGILIQKSVKNIQPSLWQYSLLFGIGILSHGILDKLARMTYHPAKADFRDPFWVNYHLFILILTIFLVYQFWKSYKWGMICAILPDLDWIIIHSGNFFSIQIPFWKEPILHKYFLGFMNNVVPFSFLNNLPDFRLVKITVFLEITPLLLIISWMYWKEYYSRNKIKE